MALPLVMTGPGGDFQTRYDVLGRDLVKRTMPTQSSQGDTETAGSFAGWSRMPQRRSGGGAENSAASEGQATRLGLATSDTFEHVTDVPSAGTYTAPGRLATASLLLAAAAWLEQQCRSLSASLQQVCGMRAFAAEFVCGPHDRSTFLAATATIAPSIAASRQENHHGTQPDPQAVAHPHPNPRPAGGTRLFADHAGAGRRVGRLQGHRVRARRGAHPQGRFAPGSQQSPLFGA